jgi:hypothetical protein
MIIIREKFETYTVGGFGHNNPIYKNPSIYEIKDIFKEYYGSWNKVPNDDRFIRVIIRAKGDIYAWAGQGEFHKTMANNLNIKNTNDCWFAEMYLNMEGKVLSIAAQYMGSELGKKAENELSKNKNIKNISSDQVAYL